MQAFKSHEKGFSLIELLLVIGIFTILSSFAFINLSRSQNKVSLDAAVDTIVSDLRAQQLRAMIGDSEGGASGSAYGVYFETDKYTLFKGTSYSAGAASNLVVNLDKGTTLTTINLPSTSIIFAQRSGDVSGFVLAQNSVTLQDPSGNQKVISVNKYGVPQVL